MDSLKQLIDTAERAISTADDLQALEETAVDARVDSILTEQVPHSDLGGFLAQSIHAADPLLDTHGIPGQVVIDHRPGELEVNTFAADLR